MGNISNKDSRLCKILAAPQISTDNIKLQQKFGPFATQTILLLIS